MILFVIPHNLFHVKRYNSPCSGPFTTRGPAWTPDPATTCDRMHGTPRSGVRPCLRIIGVWQHKQSSPYASEQRAALAISVALLRAVISPSRSTGSTLSYLNSRSCLPTRLKTSGWRFYRSSRPISLRYPDGYAWRDPSNPVALRAAELARQLREPR
jgi:hypothetical protein